MHVLTKQNEMEVLLCGVTRC